MICFPNAKINLGLHVVEKRNDGYHNIETCFYPIPLKDALEIVPADDFSFTQMGLLLDSSPNDNLVMKVLNLFRQKYDVPPLSIYLKKSIPFGAGLGGGSSDAAFMIKLLNAYTSQNLSDEDLELMAGEIGADCPFFIRNTPTFATGTGNIFDSIELALKGYTLCIIKPDLMISTKEAFSAIIPTKPSVPLREILQRPVIEWKEGLKNDFETCIFQKYPVIAEIKAYLYAHEAVYA
ncbi:MAG: 4-(cytidine 5'-diphospho)-2-C-methyl-D-erythritol kinase, partial [Tannerella sp.]|nr:4-(cytidine 5'-diphospho)-2-C-methyl-D-erythritol kinase [Tannerella sp.]